MAVFSLPTTSESQMRVDEVCRFLGRPLEESQLSSDGSPFFYQAVWVCGCSVEYVHEEPGAYAWEKCGEHSSQT